MKKSKLLVALFVVASYASALHAADYVLAEGQSDTISTNVVYETMNVAGDLSVYVPGGKSGSVKAVGFKSQLNLNGAKLTINPAGGSQYFRFGYPGGNQDSDPKPTVNLTNNTDGVYASLSIKNINAGADMGLCCEKIYLRKQSENATPGNGIIDFARLEKGSLFVRQLYNYTTCTGRVVIAGGGSSYFCRRGRSKESDFFASGPFVVRLEDNSTWLCYFYNNRGDFNTAGVEVLCEGVGNVIFNQRLTSTASFRRGAYLNHHGKITLNYAESTKDDNDTYYAFEGSEIIGPNVTNVVAGTSSKNVMKITFSANVVQTLKNVAISGAGPYVTGGANSRIRINADDDDRTVKLNIRSGDALTIEKIGQKEMVVSATTNFSHLVVSEGTVRITEDCVIEDLKLSKGTALIADGCRVTIPGDVEYVGGHLHSCNGGEIVTVSAARTMLYDLPADGLLHFSGGTNVFSRHGIDKKHWRWTFFSVYSGLKGMSNRALYLFAGDGSWQNEGLGYSGMATENTTSVLAEKQCRWRHHSSTNIVHNIDENKWGGVDYLKAWFDRDEAGNHCTNLKSPIINPEDPNSWVGVEMHLSSKAAPITGYNLRVHHTSRYANGWTVEVSDDGVNWDLVDIRSNVVCSFSSDVRYPTYDNITYLGDFDETKGLFNAKELFHFTGYRTDGLTPSEEPLALQVDGDAMVDLRAFTGGQSVNALTVDLDPAIKGGEVFGAKIAATGTLTIKNAGKIASGTILPLKLPESIDGENIKDWSVVIDGKSGIYRAMLQSDGGLVLVGGGTMMILL